MKKSKMGIFSVVLALGLCAGILSACTDSKTNTNTSSSPVVSLYDDAADTTDMFTVAMRVGDIEVSVAEYNIYYIINYTGLNQQYLSGEYGMDVALVTEEGFLAEVESRTEINIHDTVSMAAEARENNITLSAEGNAYLEQNLSEFYLDAANKGISVDEAIAERFDVGVTEEILVKYLTDTTLAQQWYYQKLTSFTYDQTEYEASYEKHHEDLDTYSFRYCLVTAEDSEEDTKKAARGRADAFLNAAVDGVSFDEAALQFADEKDKAIFRENPDVLSFRYNDLSNFPGYLRAWLADPARLAGDKTVLETEDGGRYDILYFFSRQRADYHPVSVRHILFTYQDDQGEETEAPTDMQREAAMDKAQETYDQWSAGEATEDSFAIMASEISDDETSSENGGLIENIPLGMMVPAFEDWCFDNARKPGDVGLVETVIGVHIIYCVSKSDKPAWVEAVHEIMAMDDMQVYLDGLEELYPVKKDDFGMGLTQAQLS